MQTWRDAPNTGDVVICTLDNARGRIVGGYSGGHPFTCVVCWHDVVDPVVYPLPVPETIRKALPWE
jgi:hypothetical protein